MKKVLFLSECENCHLKNTRDKKFQCNSSSTECKTPKKNNNYKNCIKET